VPLLRRVGAFRASLRSVLRTLRPSMHLTQNLSAPRAKGGRNMLHTQKLSLGNYRKVKLDLKGTLKSKAMVYKKGIKYK
jgi:hypothetical protein